MEGIVNPLIVNADEASSIHDRRRFILNWFLLFMLLKQRDIRNPRVVELFSRTAKCVEVWAERKKLGYKTL